jgi:putative DNA methylase
MIHPVKTPKKLIEVALPLDVINAASRREGFIYRGNPSALHKWWAQRPLAAARAVIFGQLVNDPEDLWRHQNPAKEPLPQHKSAWTKARTRLFKIIEDLVVWENSTNEAVLSAARDAIGESWKQICELNKDHPLANELFDPRKIPGLQDPFAGGGAIPLEAQRLGLDAFASDLNPVAVLINKAIIEIPPRFAGRLPVNPEARADKLIAPQGKGADGLAEDVRRYGQFLRNEAQKRIGHLYPAIEITKEMARERPDLKPMVGQKLTVITWLWARTVKSPNPAFAHIEVPLASTFVLSSKEGREVYVEPVVEKNGYHFGVKTGKPPEGMKAGTSFGKQKGFRCLMSQTPIEYEYIRAEAREGRMGQKLMAIVVESNAGRLYISPDPLQERLASSAVPAWMPDLKIPDQALGFRVQLYGMQTYGDLYTKRQLVALTTFSDLVGEIRQRIRRDAVSSGLPDDEMSLVEGGTGATAYSEAVSTYLAFAVDKCAEYGCTIVPWYAKEDRPKGLFARQAIPMVWDFAEVNPLCSIGGSLEASVNIVAQALEGCDGQIGSGSAEQLDARTGGSNTSLSFISTDPPYYDNIGYADLSDFFYVWLRRTLRPIFPSLLSTMSSPKADELVATPFRHGSKAQAEKFFLQGMKEVMQRLSREAHPAAPITIYYAFKQSETKDEATSSSGWETFLDAVLSSGLSISGTWPMRTERVERSVGLGTNSLASSIVLVCRPRAKDAGTISRRQFARLLNDALPVALDAMTRPGEDLTSPVAPVDLSQAIIGPGIAIFSRYEAVLEADGTSMSIKTALQLINRYLAEDDFDHDTQFCLHWFEQHGWKDGKFGEADVLARARGTSVDGVKHAGVLFAAGGIVRLLKWAEYRSNWDPEMDTRLPIWEVLHQLIRVFKSEGESGAGSVLASVQAKAESTRQLAYRLYTLCERAGWAEDARAYNEIITSWSAIESEASRVPQPKQAALF